MLKCKVFKPNSLLANHIKYFYLLDYGPDNGAPIHERITPDGCIEVNFTFSGESIIRHETSGSSEMLKQFYVVSRFKRPYILSQREKIRMVGVCFYPWGIKTLVKVPLNTFTDEVLDQNEIFGKKIQDIQNTIIDINDPQVAIDYLERYFLKELYSNSNSGIDIFVAYSAQQILKCRGKLNLDTLYSRSSFTQRRIQQKFNECLGVSPKFYLRLVKFQSGLNQLEKSSFQSLTQLALECGYYDQSHFIRDFKEFTGLSPKMYLKEKHPFNDLIIKNAFAE